MALIITHPDYMSFQNKKQTFEEYPASMYKEFLSYVKSKYSDQYWNGLPRDVAQLWNKKYTNGSKHLCKSVKIREFINDYNK